MKSFSNNPEPNDLNLENLKKLDSTNKKSNNLQKNNYFEISSILVNPSDTQSLLEEKERENSSPINDDKSLSFNKGKKPTENPKQSKNYSKSSINQKDGEQKNSETKEGNGVIIEEPHFEENHTENTHDYHKNMFETENFSENMGRCEKEMIERISYVDHNLFEVLSIFC